ncbi:hypothetical protein N9C66_08705 [Akkermansiaceae bacterium]|nr:hypothetical protein [Akkermansiaceae bacterium]MDA7908221.1 hypothetical protein [Akkermansiaceae bacterium]MDA9831408.1 hypothetical protein [Akkermansiaceae bacterium]
MPAPARALESPRRNRTIKSLRITYRKTQGGRDEPLRATRYIQIGLCTLEPEHLKLQAIDIFGAR